MPLVTYSCTAPEPASAALEVLAKLQDAEVSFSSGELPSMTIVTEHPILGSTTSESTSWVGCARSLSSIVPSLGLWEGTQVESWVDAAATTLIPVLTGKSHVCKDQYLFGDFSHRFLFQAIFRTI